MPSNHKFKRFLFFIFLLININPLSAQIKSVVVGEASSNIENFISIIQLEDTNNAIAKIISGKFNSSTTPFYLDSVNTPGANVWLAFSLQNKFY